MWVQISLPSSSFITSPPLSLSTSPSLFSFWSYGRSQLPEALKQKGKNKGTPLTAVTYLAICLWLRTTIKICVKCQNATEHNYTQISSTTSTVYEGEDLVAIAGRLFKCPYSFTLVSSAAFRGIMITETCLSLSSSSLPTSQNSKAKTWRRKFLKVSKLIENNERNCMV